MAPHRLIFIFAWTSLCLLSRVTMGAEATDRDGCPGPGEAFVTTCSGPDSPPDPDNEPDVSDLDEEVSGGFRKQDARAHTHDSCDASTADKEGAPRDVGPEDTGIVADGTPSFQTHWRATVRRYYEPLPSQGKCALGTLGGFAASRLSLGVANRVFRCAGATWVLSEVMETSGFCDEAYCVPEEARPWIAHLRRALRKQCIRVRIIARRIWDRDRIREIAQKDGMAAGGFAAGAFIGFIV